MTTLEEKRKKEKEATDKMLDELHNNVMGTRDIALRMGTHLEEHDKMLDTLGNRVDQTRFEVDRQNKSIVQMIQASEHRGFWVAVIALLLLMIILISV